MREEDQLESKEDTPHNRALFRRKLPEGKLVVAGLLFFLLTTGWLIWQASQFPKPDPQTAETALPSIAVLPFANLSNDPAQDYFSDGITADLITDLSQVSGLRVIARSSTFAYKNKMFDVQAAGKELGVKYIVEGSVNRSADQLRINASLIETTTGETLWAERFDGKLDNMFKLQDVVTEKVVLSLKVRLSRNEITRLAHHYTKSVEAYDLFLQGWQHLWEQSKEGNSRARDFFLKAVELDKQFARAWANLAISYAYDFMNGWGDESTASLDKALRFAHQAVTINPDMPQAHWAKGMALSFDRQYGPALEEARMAIDLDPNSADGYGLIAWTLNYAGKPGDALTEMQKAMQLNPHHPSIYKAILGEILFNMKQYEEAIKNFELALDSNPEAQGPRLWLAAALAHAGRVEEANWQLELVRSADDDISLAQFDAAIPFRDPKQKQHLIDGLAAAGLN